MGSGLHNQPWSFDVSSLMVLVGEAEEHNYRLSRRCFKQCFVTAPVVGVQEYIRSYDWLLDLGSVNYFSPYGCKSAPLRNIQLANTIRLAGLLKDHRYTVFQIPDHPLSQCGCTIIAGQKEVILWVVTTWVLFAGLLAFVLRVPGGTWVGLVNCTAFTGWSSVLRLIEHFSVVPAPYHADHPDPNEYDAIFITGRDSAAFVLEGRREDIKYWISRGLHYKRRLMGIPSGVWRGFTRMGSLLILLFIFSTIPNGSTIDQVAFIILNGLAQLNVLVGQQLNSRRCLAQLTKVLDTRVETRTHVYARLLRQFNNTKEGKDWIETSGLLPRTATWDEWKKRILEGSDMGQDPKELYNQIHQERSFP